MKNSTPCYDCIHFKSDNLDDKIDYNTGFITIGKCKMLHKRCRIKPNNINGCAYFKNKINTIKTNEKRNY